jgi:membrane-associated phospholipid phosphatase
VGRAAGTEGERSGVPVSVAGRIGWHKIRIAAGLAYLGGIVCLLLATGVPTGTTSLAALIVVGLGVASLGEGWRRMARIIADWIPFTLVLLLYDRTRGVVESLGMSVHESDIVSAERGLFAGNVPTVWLQQHLYDPLHVHVNDALATLIYTSHFLATPILAAVLWLRNRRLWLRYISRVVVLSVAGLITYVLFPEAPPWMAARDGLIDPVARLSARGWVYLHADNLNDVLARAQQDGANPVAAMPSLHVALATLVALFLGSLLRSRWRYLLAVYPVAMGATLVYTGEHYVLDLLAGVLYALLVHGALCRWEARRAARAGN